MAHKNRYDFISNDSISLFYFVVDGSSALRYKSILSSEEMEKADKFRFESDHIRYIVCRSVLRLLLGYCCRCKPEALDIKYKKYGKPHLDAKNAVYFNVSHSDEQCLIGISKHAEIGVDIENIKTLESVNEMSKTIFNQEEMNLYETVSSEQKMDFFYACWVRKEALFKALGIGISDELRSITVGTILPGQDFFQINLPSKESQWYIRNVPVHQTTKAAYCVKNQPIDYTLYHLQNSDIEELYSNDFKD